MFAPTINNQNVEIATPERQSLHLLYNVSCESCEDIPKEAEQGQENSKYYSQFKSDQGGEVK